MLEALLEGLGGLLLELLFQMLGEVLVSLGISSAEHALGVKRAPNPLLAGLGSVWIGAAFGALSALAAPKRLFPVPPVPGLTIWLLPPALGLAMEGVGRWFDARERPRPPLTTFWGAAAFSLGMSAARFLLVT
jgi:hypothetical protein